MAEPQEPITAAEPIEAFGKDERMWGTFCHLAALASYIFPFAGNILGPLVVWLVKRDEYPFVDDQGKESMNFQITITIAELICAVTCVGIVLIPVVHIYSMVMLIIAAVKANDGVRYRYPLSIRFIS